MSRSKHTPPQTWLRKFKRDRWMMLLSGATSKLSIVRPGLERWISSMAATHAPHSQPPASAKARKTRDTFGRGLDESFPLFALDVSFLRTWRATSLSACAKSLPTWLCSDTEWKATVKNQRSDYSARLKSAHPTSASASSSSGSGETWPTPRANDPEKRGNFELNHRSGLPGAVVSWPTPRASENENRTTKHAPSHGNGHGKTLAGEVQTWATPRATDGDKGGPNQRGSKGDLMLPSQVQQSWPTPAASDTEGSRRPAKDNPNKVQVGLPNAVERAENWPTPAASEGRLGFQDRSHGMKGTQESLTTVVIAAGHPDPENPSANGSPRGQLNPDWVEALMGIPIGWTDCGSAATASCQTPQPAPGLCSTNE
jgi:hypothetical protein